MPVTVRGGDILFNDGTTQSSAANVSNAFDGVGSYAVAYYAANDPNGAGTNRSAFLARGTTIAGSSLRVNSRATANDISMVSEPGLSGIANPVQSSDNSRVFPTANTTTLSGTWRLMLGAAWSQNFNYTYFWRASWYPLLLVRIA